MPDNPQADTRNHTARIRIEGADLHVRIDGNPSGRPLVFLHGGLGSLEDFDGLAPVFANFLCIRPDSRGHGASEAGTTGLSYPRLAADAEGIIRQLGLERPVVIGFSDGGIAGLHIAARGRCPLAGLVTLGAHMNPPERSVLDGVYRTLTASAWRERFPEMAALYEARNPAPDWESFFARVVGMWCNTATGNYPGQTTGGIKCPTLVLAGDDDHLVTRRDTVTLANAVRGAHLGIIPFGSHVLHQRHPERVAPYIRTFLSRLEE